MEPTTKPPTTLPSSNPPSVEVAYKRKSIALKKRLNEVESENELMRQRNQRGWKYIQKMRLESCILLERLAKVTGMAEEAQAGMSPELRAHAAAMLSNASALNSIAVGGEAPGHNNNGPGVYLEDETEGSSDEQPPTPQERPLRVKRSRKSNANEGGDDEMPASNNAHNNLNNHGNNLNVPDNAGHQSMSLPRLAPAPSQEEMTSSFRIQTGSNGSAAHDHNRDSHPPASGYGYPPHDQHNTHQTQSYHFQPGLSHMHPSPAPAPAPAPEPAAPAPMDVDSKDLKEES